MHEYISFIHRESTMWTNLTVFAILLGTVTDRLQCVRADAEASFLALGRELRPLAGLWLRGPQTNTFCELRSIEATAAVVVHDVTHRAPETVGEHRGRKREPLHLGLELGRKTANEDITTVYYVNSVLADGVAESRVITERVAGCVDLVDVQICRHTISTDLTK